jgi:transposase-like protein
MKSVNELLELFMRQAELEKAMRQPGGARVTEEQELNAVRQKLAKLPEATGISAAPAMGPPKTAISDCKIDGM